MCGVCYRNYLYWSMLPDMNILCSLWYVCMLWLWQRKNGGIWHPAWNVNRKRYSYVGVAEPDKYMLQQLDSKMVLHLTMSQVRGICMLRKNLRGPEDVAKMPSYLGSLFRTALFGEDKFDYASLITGSVETKQANWKLCRDSLGMHATPDPDSKERQQYTGQDFFAHS